MRCLPWSQRRTEVPKHDPVAPNGRSVICWRLPAEFHMIGSCICGAKAMRDTRRCSTGSELCDGTPGAHPNMVLRRHSCHDNRSRSGVGDAPCRLRSRIMRRSPGDIVHPTRVPGSIVPPLSERPTLNAIPGDATGRRRPSKHGRSYTGPLFLGELQPQRCRWLPPSCLERHFVAPW